MLRYFSAILLSCFSLLTVTVNAADYTFEEGKHYTDIKLDTSKKASIVEFFSYYCPHCYQFEQTAHYLEEQLAPTKITKLHVNFLSAANVKIQDELSKALIFSERLGFNEQFTHATFNYIHEQKQRFRTPNDVWQFVEMVGPAVLLYDKLKSHPAITEEFEKRIKLMDMLSEMKVLTGVPTLVINNRYIPINKSIKSNEEYIALIKHLTEKL